MIGSFLSEDSHSPLPSLEVVKAVTGTIMQVLKAALNVTQFDSF
jgi:hypothetical protein